MENRLKERLTGAAILVALIVLLVPEMFRGQRAPSGGVSGAVEGPPVRSYTLDLSTGAGAPIPVAPAAPASAVPAASTAPAMPADPAPTPAPAAASSTSSPPSAAESAAPPPSATPRSAAPPAQHATPAESTRPAADSGGHWSVQLGLFANRDNAERLAHMAESKGFHVSVTAVDDKGRYHVHAAGLHDRSSAQALLARLKAVGLPGAVVAP